MRILDYIKNLFQTNKKYPRIITTDLHKTIGEPDQLEVGLFDGETPLQDKNVTININGVDYTRKTDNEGIARLNINLPVGNYDTHVSFDDPDYIFVRTSIQVTVNPVINTQDMKMTEKDGSQFIAIATNKNGVRLSGVPITFKINGVDYNRTTDMVGEAKININLNKGDYDITTTSLEVTKKNTIHIDEKPKKVTRMDGVNISKAYSDKTQYQCAVYDDTGRVAGTVIININGVDYTRTPDTDGLYKLNINLQPGTYQLTAKYQGDNEHLPSQIVNTIQLKFNTNLTVILAGQQVLQCVAKY